MKKLLTRNPLADSYVLGISGGASVCALLVLWISAVGGAVIIPEWGVALGAAAGALLAAVALATGAGVATGGAIGFVGLVVPHALRLIGARAAAVLLPASALGGGAFVVLADAVARTVVAPMQLLVGVIAAAVGLPSFLLLPKGSAGVRR